MTDTDRTIERILAPLGRRVDESEPGDSETPGEQGPAVARPYQ